MSGSHSPPLVLALLILVAAALPVRADEEASDPEVDPTFSDEITVTAVGEKEPVDEVPLAVTVITREELDDSQTDAAPAALRRVPGLTVTQSGTNGAVTSIFTRGTESDHTLVLFDGVRLNSPEFGGFDFSQMSTAGLERIEVARGPYSALWGADALGGAINFVPSGENAGSAARLSAEGGDGAWRRYEAFVGHGGEHFDLFLSAFDREGEDDLPNSDFSMRQQLADFGWTWGPDRRLAVVVHNTESEIGIPYTSPGTLTPERRQESSLRTVAVPLRWRVSPGWRLEATASRVERTFDFSDPTDPWGFTESRTDTSTDQLRLASHHRFSGHVLSWGGEWREDEVQAGGSYGTTLNRRGSKTVSAFAQDRLTVARSLSIVFGARWDSSDEWGSEVSPRVAAAWTVSDGVVIRGGFGAAYRQPSLGELHYPGSGNSDLEPETSKSIEMGISLRGPAGAPLELQVNAFATDIDQLILFDFATFTNSNIGRADIRGLEAILEWTPLADLHSTVHLTWLDTEDENGNPLLRRPEFSGGFHLNGRLLPWLRGGLSLTYVGDRDDVDPTTYATARAGSFLTASLAMSARIFGNLAATFRATNLLDEEYAEVLGYPAPGRRLFGGLRLDL